MTPDQTESQTTDQEFLQQESDWFDWCSDSAISMLGSMLVHLVVLLLLACVVLGQEKRSKQVSLMVSLHDSDGTGPPDHLAMFEIGPIGGSPELGDSDPLEPLDEMEMETPLDSSLATLVTSISSPLEMSTAPAPLTSDAVTTSVGGGGGGSGNGSGSGVGNGSGGGGLGSLRGATFMGASAKGTKFVFVVDSSRSMFGPRWQFACEKLIESLSRLEDTQEYYVLCFDSETKYMFNGRPGRKQKFQGASSGSIRRVKQWLNTVVLGSATKPAEALCVALEMNPDAIFLLSDGELQDNTLKVLGVVNGKGESGKTPIHTIHLFSESGRETLRQIAAENNGSFTPITPPPGVPLF